MEHLPPAETFVDLFAGGCSVTHAAILSGKYKRFIVNDINAGYVNYFARLARGEEQVVPRWFSKDEYLASDSIYARIVFTFAQKCVKTYICPGARARCWHATFDAVFFDEWDLFEQEYPECLSVAWHECDGVNSYAERWARIKGALARYLSSLSNEERLAAASRNVDYLRMLSRPGRVVPARNNAIERTLRQIGIEGIARDVDLLVSSCDYRDVIIPGRSVVYCDPPYRGTDQSGYLCKGFDSVGFYAWASGKGYYVSEYNAPFTCIAEFKKVSSLSSSRNKTAVDRLFIS